MPKLIYKSNSSDYNNEPVIYCKNCLSLNIQEDEGISFCDCGCTENREAHIEDWERLFHEEYGTTYLSMPNDTFKQIVDARE